MKLNIGSNTVRHAGFLNLDIRPGSGVDLVGDAATLDNIEPGSCNAIIAHNILEHFPYDRTAAVLGVWVSRLAAGGSIEIGVPDAIMIFERYKAGRSTRSKYRDPWLDLNHSIFGNLDLLRRWHGEAFDQYGHQAVFCEDYLRRLMVAVGVAKIERVKANHPDNVTLRGIKAGG